MARPPLKVASAERLRFPRQARLKRRRLIRPLFDKTRQDVGTISVGSIRLLYRVAPRSETGAREPVQVGFAVGRMGGAVRRNAAKRAMRETYRANQKLLRQAALSQEEALTVMILYRGRKKHRCLRGDLAEALRQLPARIGAVEPPPFGEPVDPMDRLVSQGRKSRGS